MNTGRRLGRGLSGLLQSTVAEPTVPESTSAQSLPVSEIRPNPYQPRRKFDDGALADLKASIAQHGVLQPVIVRRATAGGYELVAGERRFRACRDLGHQAIPAVIRDVDDASMQMLALVENLQREDLNAIEKARAIQNLMASQSLTQDDVAHRVGKDRSTIANLVRLLELSEDVRSMIEDGRLSFGQARAILQAPTDAKRAHLARLAVERDLSVRDVERYARLSPGAMKRPSRKTADPFLADIEERIRRSLGAKVRVRSKRRGGVIEIEYADPAHLDVILGRLGSA